MDTLERADRALDRLQARYGARHAYLAHETPFQLLVAVVLSAQDRDAVVDRVTPALFHAYPDARALQDADLDHLRELLAPLRYAWTKAAWIRTMARLLVERHDGEVPASFEELTALPGVGPKTASVVQGYVFGGADALAVDVHVNRVAYRLAFASTPDKADLARHELESTFARPDWPSVNFYLIKHGRTTCVARRPRCGECVVEDLCPKIGVTEEGPARVTAKSQASPGAPRAAAAAWRKGARA